MYMHLCMHTCACMHSFTHTHMHARTHARTHTPTHKHTCLCAYIVLYTCMLCSNINNLISGILLLHMHFQVYTINIYATLYLKCEHNMCLTEIYLIKMTPSWLTPKDNPGSIPGDEDGTQDTYPAPQDT